VNLTNSMKNAGVKENPLRRRRFPGVDMGGNADITKARKRYVRGYF
jgi:hypothetical protein